MTPEQANLIAAVENEVREARARAVRRRSLASVTFDEEFMLALANTDDAAAALYETFANKMKSEWER